MHRSFPIHFPSLVYGLAFGLLCILAMGPTSIRPEPMGTTAHTKGTPVPRDVVEIRGGTPYVVPAGTVFVLMGLGSLDPLNSGGEDLALLVNGQRKVTSSLGLEGTPATSTMNSVPVGFTVPAGSTIEVVEIGGSSASSISRAWGYLAPQ